MGPSLSHFVVEGFFGGGLCVGIKVFCFFSSEKKDFLSSVFAVGAQ
jgi:hypothetical protein